MRKLLAGLTAIALSGTLSPTAAHAAGCSVALSGPVSCTYVVLTPGTGRLSLTVTSGFAVANVGCTVGGAVLPGTAPFSGSTPFTRVGVCFLQITGSGSATASAT
jgi:hypothetical protein